MELKNTCREFSDDHDWSERSEFWRNYRAPARGRRKKFKFREPLILCGHGVKIRVDHNTLLIRNGFTHFPQNSEEIRLFPGDGNLPDRIIILDASGGISFDALNWMSEQKIAFVQLNWRGQIIFSGNSGFVADPKLVKLQVEIRDTKKALEINRKLILAKFDACIETLSVIFPNSDASEIAIRKIRYWKSQIANSGKSHSFDKILGYEGVCATAYHKPWHELPLKWSRLSERPIPVDWQKVGSRSMVWQREANNARHPLNAMLNYGYGMLISQVQTEIVAAGFDPSIGIAHRRHTNPIPLVYDLMEPLRPVVDRKILTFALGHTFEPGDFTINKSGGCRLNPQMAKAVATQVSDMESGTIVKHFTRLL